MQKVIRCVALLLLLLAAIGCNVATAPATVMPSITAIAAQPTATPQPPTPTPVVVAPPTRTASEPKPPTKPLTEPALTEQHFTIFYGDTGYSYESLIGPYLHGAQKIVVEDPYVRAPHQIQNFVRFCEAVVTCSMAKQIHLITSYDSSAQRAEIQEKLGDLQQSLLELDIVLDIDFNPNLHDREIRMDNSWVIKIGRGLDFYQKPTSWYEIGANDLSLRKCLETKVDIFRVNANQ